MFKRSLICASLVFSLPAMADDLATLKAMTAPKRVSPDKISTRLGGTSKIQTADRALYNECFADEEQYLSIEKQVLYPWMKAWKNKEPASFARTTSFPGPESEPTRTFGAIREYGWGASKESKKPLSDYLGQFSRIADFSLDTVGFYAPKEYRGKDLAMKKADLTVRYDLRGFEAGGSRRQDVGALKVSVELMGDKWQVSHVDILSMNTLRSDRPTFQDVTASSGLGKVVTYPRVEAIRRGGYAMAVADFDGDGIQDLYVGEYGRSQLFKGHKDGAFTEVTDSGIKPDTLVKTALFADLDNDGKQDLIVVRFVPGTDPRVRKRDVVIYHNLGAGKFEELDTVHGLDLTDYAMPATVADFNGDGLLDFYIGFPGKKDFTVLGDVKHAKGNAVQGIYTNQKNMKFVGAALKALNAQELLEADNRIFPHSALAADINHDGKPDLLVMNDRGYLSPAYINKGDGTFAQASSAIGVQNYQYGMGAAVGDIDNDGVMDIIMTNVDSAATYRLQQSCFQNWDASFDPDHAQSKSLRAFKGDGQGHFTEVTQAAGLEWAGQGLAGAEFVDYNNDGLADIYVANGLWSGTDRSQDLSSYFARARLLGSRAYHNAALNEMRDDTQSAFMRVLANFKGDLQSGTKGDLRPQMAGHQHHRLFRNLGGGKFMDVAFLEGIDTVADGYTVAFADIDGDRNVDIILRNGDPGTKDVNYPPVQVFKNVNPEFKNVLKVKLIGTVSNRDGIGAEVKVTAGDLSQTKQLLANNGTAQSEKALYFGLGKATRVDTVSVKWPSGAVQFLKDLKPGEVTIQEEGMRQARR